MNAHACNGEPVKDPRDGFYVVGCACGWCQRGLPDLETAVDALMQHAYERGVNDRTPITPIPSSQGGAP